MRALALLLCLPLAAETVPKGYAVRRYRVALRPDFAAKAFHGRETVAFRAQRALEDFRLDAHGLAVSSLRLDGRPAPFRCTGDQLVVQVPPAAGTAHRVDFTYQVAPSAGVHWEARQVYTAWATSHWMACDDDPSGLAALSLEVTVPKGMKVAGSGRLEASTARGGFVTTRWVRTEPVPAFVFGFAAGDFHEATGKAGAVALRFLGERHDATQLRTIFTSTADMVAFFEAKAGVPLPGGRYTQLLVAGGPRQEVAAFTLLGSEIGDNTLKDPADLWLQAHELAHQWWGIGVACADWSDFWLNEGIATFLADAYLEHAFGPERYAKEMDLVRQHVEKAVQAGKARPLHFTGWTKVSEAGGSWPYNRGAWVLKLLREKLGDAKFWAGLRRYTTDNLGRAVTSEDFRKGMEAGSGEDLREFFATEVER